MKKVFCTAAAIFLVALWIVSFQTPVYADTSAGISLSAPEVSVGDTITVTVNFISNNENITSVSGTITYDETVIEFISGDGASGGAGNIPLNYSAPTPSQSLSAVLTFRAVKAGTTSISLGNCTIYTDGGVSIGNPSATSEIKVSDPSPALSSNANLKSLEISQGQLTPNFSPDITEYSVTVPNSINKLPISAVADDSKAKVSISGSSDLVVGENKRSIIVTAEDGTQKTYTITIIREAAVNTPSPSPSPSPSPTPDRETPSPSPSKTEPPTYTISHEPDPTITDTEPTGQPQSPAPTQDTTVKPTGTPSSGEGTGGSLKASVVLFLALSSIIITLIMFMSVYIIKKNDAKKHTSYKKGRNLPAKGKGRKR